MNEQQDQKKIPNQQRQQDQQAQQNQKNQQNQQNQPDQQDQQMRPVRMLLVEDDDIDRDAMLRHVRKEGLPYQILVAETEAQALEALEKESYDVVLLDYDLRTATGLDLLPHTGDTPAIFITGSGTEAIAVEAIRKGASDYLIKDPERNYLTVLPLTIRNVLGRRDAEKALRDSEARFRALTEKVGDLALIIGKDGIFTYASPSARMFGYPPEELIGMKLSQFIHPDDLHFVKKSLAQSAQRPYEAIRLHEIRARIKAGPWVQLEGLLTNMYDEPGINGIVVNGRDITQRKRIEEALDESEAKLRTTLSSISDLVFGLDQNGVIIDYHRPSQNQELYKPSAERLGKLYSDVLPPHLTKLLGKAMVEATSTGKVQHLDYPMVVDGKTYWFEAKVSIRKNHRGESRGFTVVARNITDRKQAEEALKQAHDKLEQRVEERTRELKAANENLRQEIHQREISEDALRKSEERLTKFMNSATESFFLLDANLNFITINKRGLEILEKNNEHVIGKNLADILPDSRSSGRYERHLEVIRTGEPFTIEDFVSPFTSHDFRGILKSFKVGDGLGVMLIDTTDSKRLEEQLRQSQKMEAIGSLAGGIAHDFNNILGIIMGYTYLALDDTQQGSRTRGNLEHVLSAAERAKQLVSQILTFSRKSEKKHKPLLLDEIVTEVLKLLRSTLPTTIDIRYQVEGVLNAVLANSTQIHQVVMNICTNAAHAMREKGGVLKITLKEIAVCSDGAEDAAPLPSLVEGGQLPSGQFQQLTFSDTGQGMVQKIVNRIFEPYYTTKKPGEGTGLGLAVVHGIVKSHGGDISVSSEPGKGTTFHIFLPVTTAGRTAKKQQTGTIEGGSERILLVDDEQELANMGKQMLEKFGYQVTSTTASVEALEIFTMKPQTFDLLITDQTMPALTGLQLAKKIRQIKPGIPIVLCTGYSENINEATLKANRIDAFIMKPFQKKDFARVIRDALNKGNKENKEPKGSNQNKGT